MIQNLTGPEKVLYRTHYNFAIEVLKLSESEAHENATKKIESVRKLAKKVHKY